MNFVSVIMAVFSMIGAVDRIFGNRLGIGKEFEKGFMLFGTLALSMIGMICLSPVIAELLQPFLIFVYNVFNIDPSVIPAMVFANDMGGATLSKEVAVNSEMGMYNAFVVSSMMGATISFNLPFALGIVAPEKHRPMLMGFLCGISTIPLGCFAAGLLCGLPLIELLLNLLPLVILALIIICGILFCPNVALKVFAVLGVIIKTLITFGLALAVLKTLTGIEIIKNLAPLSEGAEICFNSSVVMTGAFPMIYIVSKLLTKPLKKVGHKLNINEASALGFVSSMATSVTTFEMMKRMDKKGVFLNSAFAISASFVFAGHLAFTLSYGVEYLFPMIVGKLIGGITALLLAAVVYKKIKI